MITPNYPSSGELIVTFLNNVRRYSVNSVQGINPTLINVGGELMYVYIKNLSPAQLSNDNPDIWRIQLPKRKEFDEIKSSNYMFLLFGYDYVRKVYTTWNPYWCKQRLNVAESCSMYSRLSLQKRVASTQKMEKTQLQNDVEVLCIPGTLLATYLKNVRDFFPQTSKSVQTVTNLQKPYQSDLNNDNNEMKSDSVSLFEKFLGCYKPGEYRAFLQDKGYRRAIVYDYGAKLDFIIEKGYLKIHKDFFLQCTKLEEYKRAINRFCWQPDIRSYEGWHKSIIASLKNYLLFVEKKLYGSQNIRIKFDDDNEANSDAQIEVNNSSENIPSFKLDEFGKLIELDAVIVDRLAPKVKGVEYPDYGFIIKEIKAYYPPQATEKMTPADWFKLFDSTKWKRVRGRKTQSNNKSEIPKTPASSTSDSSCYVDNKEDVITYDSHIEPSEIILDLNKLNSVFDKKVTSYKYFWFIAIISIAKEKGILSISFDDIVIRMASIAWPIAMGDGIDFGERDMLSKMLKDIQKKTYLIKAASSKVVESSLYDYYKILGIDKILVQLLTNVPYRFLSPWIKFTSNEEVSQLSNKDTFEGLYSINAYGIILKSKWWEYIEAHYNELCIFTLNSFIVYLKQYNSNLKLLRFIKEGWNLDKISNSISTDNKSLAAGTEEVRENAKDDFKEFSVKVGDNLKLFPSQEKGWVVELKKDKKGYRKIVVKLYDGHIKEIDDSHYYYQKIYERLLEVTPPPINNSEKQEYLQSTRPPFENRFTNRKVKVGDWIQVKNDSKICKVIKILNFGSYEKLVVRFKGGREDWIINNPDIYTIVY